MQYTVTKDPCASVCVCVCLCVCVSLCVCNVHTCSCKYMYSVDIFGFGWYLIAIYSCVHGTLFIYLPCIQMYMCIVFGETLQHV